MSSTVQTLPPRRSATGNYTELMKQIKSAGLLRRKLGYYWTRFGMITFALLALLALSAFLGGSWWQLLVAAALAFTLGQVMFLGHDAAHFQIFSSKRRGEWSSLVLANLYAGMSYGWWQHKHTRHHSKPNQVGADPDIKTDVIIFETSELKKPLTGIRAWLGARQGYLFFPLLLLEGVNLHLSGIKTILGRGKVKRRALEIAFIGARILGYLAFVFYFMPLGIAFAFLGVQLGLFGLYMGSVFAPNHKGMVITPAGAKIDFLQRQVRASRNIRGGPFTDFMMGGLNYQIEHHLFPSLPSPSLPKAQNLVRGFCVEKGVPYTETSLMRSYKIVVSYLNKVGLSARDPFDCPTAANFRTVG